jgi:hypothetical protein
VACGSVVSGDERGDEFEAIAGGEEIMRGIERVSAERVPAERVSVEWSETEGAETRGMVEGATRSGSDVGEDGELRETGTGKDSVIVPAM